MTRLLPLLALVFALAAPASALAYPADATTLLSRPSGLAAMPAGSVNDATAGRSAVSDDGCRIVFSAASDGLSGADDDRVLNVYVRDVCAGTTSLVSRASGASGAGGDDDSVKPAISGDGSVVAFVSRAGNLGGPVEDGDPDQVYVRDLDAATTTLVSVAHGGAAAGDDTAWSPTLDQDGDTVAFHSRATNLVPGDAGGKQDVFVRRLSGTPQTMLVSRALGTGGAQGDGHSYGPSLDDAGEKVAFDSAATNLVPGDAGGKNDVFVRELSGHTIVLASRADGHDGAQGDGYSYGASLSGDGTKLAFTTAAKNIFGTDANNGPDVVVRTLTGTPANELASRADGPNGVQAAYDAREAELDDDGSRVVFESGAGNLVPGISEYATRVYVRDLVADTTVLASRKPGAAGAIGLRDDDSVDASISGDGGFVAFETYHDGIAPGAEDDFTSIVRRDLATHANVLVSRPDGSAAYAGTDVNAAETTNRAISADGRYVAFASRSDLLSSSDDDRYINVFRRDTLTDETVLISVATGGAPAHGESWGPAISADGNRIAFISIGFGGGYSQAYVRDVAAGTTTLASRADGAGPQANGYGISDVTISADGNRVAFATGATNLGGSPTASRNVYVRDIPNQTTLLASRNTAGQAANQSSTHPSLNANGTKVAFVSGATNLDAAETSTDDDVYVRDFNQSATSLVSGNVTSAMHPSISDDGSAVAYAGDGGAHGGRHVYVKPLGGGNAVLVDRTVDGEALGGYAEAPSLSANGRRVAFESTATDGPNDSDEERDVFVRDLDTPFVVLMSRAAGPSGASADRDARSAAISANGTCVTFVSTATNLGGAHPGGDFAQVYRRTLASGCPAETAPVATIAGDGPTFTLGGAGAGGSYECAIDTSVFAPCSSPMTHGALAAGEHTLRVRAIDRHGNVQSPASEKRFTVAAPRQEPETPRDGDVVSGDPGTPTKPAAQPQAPAAKPSIALAASRLKKLSGGRALGVPVRCDGARCAGTVTLKLGAKRLGRVRFSVAGGQATVRVALGKAARRLLARKPGARITVTIALDGGGGATAKLRAK